jgi:hypothetical protein
LDFKNYSFEVPTKIFLFPPLPSRCIEAFGMLLCLLLLVGKRGIHIMNSKRNIVWLVVFLLSSHVYLLHALNNTESVLSNVLRHVFVQNPLYFHPFSQWPFQVDPAQRLFADYSKVHLVHCFHT